MHTNLLINTPVFTADDEEIGKVAEVRGSLFKVNARMRPDYWLPCDAIESSEAAGVRLAFTKDVITEHQREPV